MKKLILTFALIVTLTPTCFAETGTGADGSSDTEKTYVIPVIPKPRTLPGPNDETGDNRKALIESILPNYAVGTIGFVGALSLIFLVIGGVRFATAYGREESVENAKKQVIYALVGLVVALLSYTIVSIISNIELKSDQTVQVNQPKAAPPAPDPKPS